MSEYVPDERVVLERNRYYKGPRPQHVDRFTVDIGADPATIFDQVLSGDTDYALGPPQSPSPRSRRTSGDGSASTSRSSSSIPSPGVRSFMLNTSRPLFRGNVKLRQAINFAIDRRALTRELGAYAGTVSDQFMPPNHAGLSRCAHLPARRSRPAEGAGTCVRAEAVRTGRPLHPVLPGGPGAGADPPTEPRRNRHRARDQGVPAPSAVRQAVDAGRAVRHRPRQLGRVVRGVPR